MKYKYYKYCKKCGKKFDPLTEGVGSNGMHLSLSNSINNNWCSPACAAKTFNKKFKK